MAWSRCKKNSLIELNNQKLYPSSDKLNFRFNRERLKAIAVKVEVVRKTIEYSCTCPSWSHWQNFVSKARWSSDGEFDFQIKCFKQKEEFKSPECRQDRCKTVSERNNDSDFIEFVCWAWCLAMRLRLFLVLNQIFGLNRRTRGVPFGESSELQICISNSELTKPLCVRLTSRNASSSLSLFIESLHWVSSLSLAIASLLSESLLSESRPTESHLQFLSFEVPHNAQFASLQPGEIHRVWITFPLINKMTIQIAA